MEAVCESRVPGEEEMKCTICRREAVADLCAYHTEAREKVKGAYPAWVKAYGRIEWEDYLDKVKRNVQTGQWAKEIAELLKG